MIKIDRLVLEFYKFFLYYDKKKNISEKINKTVRKILSYLIVMHVCFKKQYSYDK